MQTINVIEKYEEENQEINKYLKNRGVTNNSDYENIVDYKLNNSQKAFNNIYKKYQRYCREYARKLHSEIQIYDNGIGQEDLEQDFMERCILKQLQNIDINRLSPNFTFKVGLSMYLKAYQNLYKKRYKKGGISLSIDAISVNHRYHENRITHITGRYSFKKLSYDPTDEYVEKLSSEEKLKKQLSKKEYRLVNYLKKGMNLKQISEKMKMPYNDLRSWKSEVKEKCYQLVLENN